MEGLNVSATEISLLYRLLCEKLLSKDNGTIGEEEMSCIKVLGAKTVLGSPQGLFFSTGFVSKVFLSILYALAFSVAVIGNILVVLTFVFNPLMRSTTNSFIVSLAVSDFLMAITCIPINLGSVYSTYWVFGPFACKLVPYVMTLAVACSSLTLCCIALDRYKAIVHPLKLRFYITPGHVGGLLCVVWILAAVSAVPNAVFYKTENVEVNYSGDPSDSVPTHRRVTFPLCAWMGTEAQELVFQWLQLGVLFIAPFSVMIIFYGIIAHRLWIRKPIGTRTLHKGNKNTQVKKKVIKMLVIVVSLFAVCWMPLLLFNVIGCQRKPSKGLWTLRHYLQLLAMSSTCYNPIVYTIMNENFKNKFANVLFCRRNRISPATVMRGTDRQNTTRIQVMTLSDGRPADTGVSIIPARL